MPFIHQDTVSSLICLFPLQAHLSVQPTPLSQSHLLSPSLPSRVSCLCSVTLPFVLLKGAELENIPSLIPLGLSPSKCREPKAEDMNV